jgi:hypothetical protein
MVMFKAKFRPMTGKPAASDEPRASEKPSAGAARPPASGRHASATRMQQQQQQQPQSPKPKVPPIEEERGPQAPIREPEPLQEPERAH